MLSAEDKTYIITMADAIARRIASQAVAAAGPSTVVAAHAITHKAGGSDPIKLDELAAPTDVTTLNASTSFHGLLPKLPGGTTTFLRGDGAFAVPPGGGGGLTLLDVEKDLGSTPRYSGTFDIAVEGETPGSNVIVVQLAGPYTGKGTLADEAEMDQVIATGYVVDATTIRAYWNCPPKGGPVAGNVKFGYAVSV